MLADSRPAVEADALREVLIEHYLALRADGISIVRTAERALEKMGRPVETAIRPPEERRERMVAMHEGKQVTDDTT